MGIAHVSSVDPSFEKDLSEYNVSANLQPPSSGMLQSIRDIVSQENLTNVGIIYDDTFGKFTFCCLNCLANTEDSLGHLL